MLNVHNTYAGIKSNIILGLEMLNDKSFIKPYFTSTNLIKHNDDDYLLLIGYVFFCVSVGIGMLKLIYDINVKFQVVVHISCLLYEIINLMIVIFLTLL